jgi:hypothetical protein
MVTRFSHDSLRFGFGEPEGARSETWFVRLDGTEVVVGQRRRPSQLHFTAHRSGTCHIVLPHGPEKYPHEFGLATELAPGVERIFTLLVPDDAIVSGSPPARSSEPMKWLPAPGDGLLYEIVVLRVSFDHPDQRRSAPRRLASAHQIGLLSGDDCVVIVRALVRDVLPDEWQTMDHLASLAAQRRREISDGPIRTIAWGSSAADGSWYFAEVAVP